MKVYEHRCVEVERGQHGPDWSWNGNLGDRLRSLGAEGWYVVSVHWTSGFILMEKEGDVSTTDALLKRLGS